MASITTLASAPRLWRCIGRVTPIYVTRQCVPRQSRQQRNGDYSLIHYQCQKGNPRFGKGNGLSFTLNVSSDRCVHGQVAPHRALLVLLSPCPWLLPHMVRTGGAASAVSDDQLGPPAGGAVLGTGPVELGA